MKAISLSLLLVLVGCSEITPIAKYTHTSHALQHIDKSPNNRGFDMIGLGAQVQIGTRVTAEAVESYSWNKLDGRNEVFTGSITVKLY